MIFNYNVIAKKRFDIVNVNIFIHMIFMIIKNSKIFLRNYPVASLTSVKYRSGTWGAITWESLNVNDYLLNDNGKVAFSFPFPEAEKYLQIIYTGGYKIDFANELLIASHTLPFDLTQVATEIVAQSFNLRTSVGISNESTEGQSITYKDSDVTKQYQSRLLDDVGLVVFHVEVFESPVSISE